MLELFVLAAICLFGAIGLIIAGRALIYGLREWKRALSQGVKALRIMSELSELSRWQKTYGPVMFAWSDFGRVYKSIDITPPGSETVQKLVYNGRPSVV